MIFKIRRYSAMEAPRGPKMALKRPKMVPQRPQDAPRRPQERPKRVSGRLKMAQERPTRAPRRLQEGSKKGPKKGSKRVPRGTSGSSWLRDLSRNPLAPSRTPPGSSRDRPGPLRGAILRPIWTLKMDPRRAKQYDLKHICQTAQHV